MADPLIEQLRPLGLEKYAGRLTRIVSDSMQVAVGAGQIQKGLMRDEARIADPDTFRSVIHHGLTGCTGYPHGSVDDALRPGRDGRGR